MRVGCASRGVRALVGFCRGDKTLTKGRAEALRGPSPSSLHHGSRDRQTQDSSTEGNGLLRIVTTASVPEDKASSAKPFIRPYP